MMKLIGSKLGQQLFLGTAKQRIAEIFFSYPDIEFSLSDLAMKAGVKKSNIGAILEDFEKNGFIRVVRLKNIWRIRANQANIFFVRNKIIFNISETLNSGIIEYLNEKFKNPKSIVLFGSFRSGEDISTSDIDIAIETDEKIEYKIIQLNELKIQNKIVQVHLFNRKNVDLHLFNNISNGIVLSGFLEVKQ